MEVPGVSQAAFLISDGHNILCLAPPSGRQGYQSRIPIKISE